MDAENGIGKDNRLPWHLPADMRFFKETTMGHIVVLGRKNYESIPDKYRPLPQRENVILTRNKAFNAHNCIVFHSVEECLSHYKKEIKRTLFFIGGGEIYKQILDLDIVNELYITHIEDRYNADVFFPKLDLSKWQHKLIQRHEKDQEHDSSFRIVHYFQ